jgi:hypothetical protein
MIPLPMSCIRSGSRYSSPITHCVGTSAKIERTLPRTTSILSNTDHYDLCCVNDYDDIEVMQNCFYWIYVLLANCWIYNYSNAAEAFVL